VVLTAAGVQGASAQVCSGIVLVMRCHALLLWHAWGAQQHASMLACVNYCLGLVARWGTPGYCRCVGTWRLILLRVACIHG
jgi:hypothetical protein